MKYLQKTFLKNYIKQFSDFYVSRILLFFDILSLFFLVIPTIEQKLSPSLPVYVLIINALGTVFIAIEIKKEDKYRVLQQPLKQLREHTYHINSIKLSNSHNRIASCGGDNHAIVWDYPSGKVLSRLKHDSWVGNIAFSKDETKLFSISGKGTFYIWDIHSNKIIQSYGLCVGQTRGLDISPDGTKIVTSGDDGQIIISDIDHSIIYYEEKISQGEIRKVVFNHKGDLIAFGNNLGEVFTINLGKDTETRRIYKNPDNEMIRSVHFNHSDNLLAITDSGGFLTIFDIENNKQNHWKCHNGHAVCCSFSDDDRYIATGGQDNVIRIWSFSDNLLMKKFEIHGHTNTITNIIFNSNEKRLISAGRDEIINIWNIEGLNSL